MAKPARESVWVTEVGLRLAATRKALSLIHDTDMTQEKIAEFLNISRTTLTNWETGRALADVGAMRRLSERFGVTLDWIYRGDLSGLPHSMATALLAAEREAEREPAPL